MSLLHRKAKEVNKGPKLWTRNFSILVVGSLVSMAGSNIVDMVLGLEILDVSSSGMLFSLLLIIGNLVGIVIPVLIGSKLEKKRKEKVIYILDFISAGVFTGLGLLSHNEVLSANMIVFATVVFESILAVYRLAYNAFLPAIVDKENYTKAYSVDSVMENIAEGSVLLAVLGYNILGTEITMYISGALFLVAAIVETQIKPAKGVGTAENAVIESGMSIRAYVNNYKIVFKTIKETPGFLQIVLCLLIDSFRTGALWAMMLPYLEGFYPNNVILGFTIDRDYLYMVVLAFYSIGQFWSGAMNYVLNLQGKKRVPYLFVFSFIEMGTLAIFPFMSSIGGILMMFFAGIASVVTLAVYDTGVFDRLPEEMRSRFEGVFACSTAILAIVGNFVGGLIIDYSQNVDLGFLLTCLPQAVLIIVLIITSLPKIISFFDD